MNFYAEKLKGYGFTDATNAAAEIERLEAALETFKTQHDGWTDKLRMSGRIEELEAALDDSREAVRILTKLSDDNLKKAVEKQAALAAKEKECQRYKDAIMSDRCFIPNCKEPLCVLARGLRAALENKEANEP